MTNDLACPRCKRRLRVSGEAAGRWLTCPRCLASVRNPRELERAVPADPETVPLAPGGPARYPCRACGAPVERGWRVCPHCEEPLRPRAGTRRRPPDEEVRSDSRGVNVGLLALGALLVAGVALAKFWTGWVPLLGRNPIVVLVASAGLLVLAVGGLVAIGVGTGSEGVKTFTGIVGGFLLCAGMFILVIFALCIGVASTCPGLR